MPETKNGKTVPTPCGLRAVGERGSQLGTDESYMYPAFPSAPSSPRPCWSRGDLNPRTSFLQRDSSRDLHLPTLSTLFSKFSKIRRPSCFVSCAPTSPALAREISSWDERGYRSLGMFQVERTPSLDSMSAHLPAPSSRPSFVSTSCVIARAWDLPFFQKAMRGIARPAATTMLARKTARRHSTGESLSSVNSETASGALKARFLMKEGIELSGPRMLFRSEEHTSELQSQSNLVCRLLLEKKKKT